MIATDGHRLAMSEAAADTFSSHGFPSKRIIIGKNALSIMAAWKSNSTVYIGRWCLPGRTRKLLKTIGRCPPLACGPGRAAANLLILRGTARARASSQKSGVYDRFVRCRKHPHNTEKVGFTK